MSADRNMYRTAELSPGFLARTAGLCYLLNTVTAPIALYAKGTHWLAFSSGLVATASYVTVTALFYYLFMPVNRSISLAAAFFGLAGCALGVLNPLHLVPFHIHSLVVFGLYCLLIGYLILRSTFLPRILGALMMIAGLGWLTFVSHRLASYLSPYHYVAGGIGEITLTLWLLAAGVNAARWKEQAAQQGIRTG